MAFTCARRKRKKKGRRCARTETLALRNTSSGFAGACGRVGPGRQISMAALAGLAGLACDGWMGDSMGGVEEGSRREVQRRWWVVDAIIGCSHWQSFFPPKVRGRPELDTFCCGRLGRRCPAATRYMPTVPDRGQLATKCGHQGTRRDAGDTTGHPGTPGGPTGTSPEVLCAPKRPAIGSRRAPLAHPPPVFH